MTTVGDQLFEFGGKPVGGTLQLPLMGSKAKVYFVDPVNGSTSNDGTSPSRALVSVGAAYAKCVDKQGDVIYFMNDGNTTGSSREATIPLVWSKDNTHLVGWCAPAMVSQRARITPVSTAALLEAPVIDVTGNGNIFANVQIAHFGANTDAIGCQGVAVSGSRNYFYNVHIVGVPNAHSGDETDSVDLLLDGGSENVFSHCAIGIDTVARSAANANIEFTTAATRNLFENCIIAQLSDAGDSLFIKADGAGDVDRWNIFKNCTLVNAMESGATVLTVGMTVHNSCGGMIILQNSQMYGVTDVSNHGGPTWVDGLNGTTTSAIGVAST